MYRWPPHSLASPRATGRSRTGELWRQPTGRDCHTISADQPPGRQIRVAPRLAISIGGIVHTRGENTRGPRRLGEALEEYQTW